MVHDANAEEGPHLSAKTKIALPLATFAGAIVLLVSGAWKLSSTMSTFRESDLEISRLLSLASQRIEQNGKDVSGIVDAVDGNRDRLDALSDRLARVEAMNEMLKEQLIQMKK